jgi:hypothetical protein
MRMALRSITAVQRWVADRLSKTMLGHMYLERLGILRRSTLEQEALSEPFHRVVLAHSLSKRVLVQPHNIHNKTSSSMLPQVALLKATLNSSMLQSHTFHVLQTTRLLNLHHLCLQGRILISIGIRRIYSQASLTTSL